MNGQSAALQGEHRLIRTVYGDFDGTSWERHCQAAFKIKYGDEYQPMPASSPGDFGIEGWTSDGTVFQCYCPEKEYTRDELYEAIRDKITTDIPKLKKNEVELTKRLGIQIKRWIFVTPIVDDNDLHVHARKKEIEAKAWGIPLLHADFDIKLQDAGFYANEFEQCRRTDGVGLQIGPILPKEDVLPGLPREYLSLIERKNRVLLKSRSSSPTFDNELAELNQITESEFLQCDDNLAEIERASPQAYRKLYHVIGQYGNEMKKKQLRWNGQPNELVEKIREELSQRIALELGGAISHNSVQRTVDLLISRWLAVCQLDVRE
ncbi:hypothetical protein HBDW_45810 [Herbaspirillum sp. DW155]|uniref:hypothetical protein n=1 Tax=Herbaspirillum sp. DW155 TaxID=3095609 RepID=UPI00308557D9|nr:hypothetical protein HBDW_45810 [Herbaspirillum sp. DW155]